MARSTFTPLVAVASRAALYPIQSIIIIALIVSGAYFHLLDIARNSPPSSTVSDGNDIYSSSSTITAFPSTAATISMQKRNGEWKWSLDPVSVSPEGVSHPKIRGGADFGTGQPYLSCLGPNRHL
jgi:hypothetical protein